MIQPYYFVLFIEYIYILHFSYFLFYKLIHKAQVYLNCINVKLWLQAFFPVDFAFLYFLIFFPLLFSSYLYSPGHFLSYCLTHIHICRTRQTESCVGRSKEEWIIEHGWKIVALVTHHEYSVVGSHSPALGGPTTHRFPMTMEDTPASGIWRVLISHFKMEVLFCVPWAGMQM